MQTVRQADDVWVRGPRDTHAETDAVQGWTRVSDLSVSLGFWRLEIGQVDAERQHPKANGLTVAGVGTPVLQRIENREDPGGLPGIQSRSE